MPIGDYCEKPAVTVRADETVRVAAQRMRLSGVGSVAVVREGRPIGIVTDRDLALGTLGKRMDPGAVRVEELVWRPLVTVEEDAPVREAARRMRRHAVRRLPVVDDKGQLVGIVAADDILALAAGELSGLAVALRAQAPTSDESRSQP